MREDTEPRQEQVQTKAYTLYPKHIEIIEMVSKAEHRSFSNALQVILERYYEYRVREFVSEPEA